MILCIKIVELPRSPCYKRSHISLLQNAPGDGEARKCVIEHKEVGLGKNVQTQ